MPSRHQRSLSRRVVQSELTDIHLQHQHDLLVVASITAGAFVARADGWVDPAERDSLLDWMGEARLLDSISPHEVNAAFELRLRQFDQPGGVAEAVETLRRAAGMPRARLVVAGAEQVARADGQFQQSEARAVGLVRRTLFPSQALPIPRRPDAS